MGSRQGEINVISPSKKVIRYVIDLPFSFLPAPHKLHTHSPFLLKGLVQIPEAHPGSPDHKPQWHRYRSLWTGRQDRDFHIHDRHPEEYIWLLSGHIATRSGRARRSTQRPPVPKQQNTDRTEPVSVLFHNLFYLPTIPACAFPAGSDKFPFPGSLPC